MNKTAEAGQEYTNPLGQELLSKFGGNAFKIKGLMIQAFIEGAAWQASQSQWISVKDRLPEYDVRVNVAFDENVNSAFVTRSRNGHKWMWDVFDEVYSNITHWQPLPKPPKETGK